MSGKILWGFLFSMLTAFAARADFTMSGTSFESFVRGASLSPSSDDNGENRGYRYWYCEATQVGVITNADAFGSYAKPCGRPAIAPADKNENCLFVSSGFRLYRTLEPNNALSGPSSFEPVDIGAGLYFDSMVSFQATDVDQVLLPGEKLLVWLKGEDDGPRELIVSAGYFPSETSSATTMRQKDYVIRNISVKDGEWHRVTIKLIADITSCSAEVPGLIVYIDGERALYDGDAGDAGTLIGSLNSTAARHYEAGRHALFPSFDRSRTTLTSVAVEGTGAVDDMSFTRVAPSFAVDRTPFTLKWTAHVQSFTYRFGPGGSEVSVTAGSSGSRALEIDMTTSFDLQVYNVKYDENYAQGYWLDTEGKPFEGTTFKAGPFRTGTIVADQANFLFAGRGYARFDLLQDAVTGSSAEIRMLRDVNWEADTPAIWVNDDLDLTIDLYGHSVTETSDYWPALFVEAGRVLLKNSGAQFAGRLSGGYENMLVLAQGGELTIGSATGDNGLQLDGDVCDDSYTWGKSNVQIVRGRFKDGNARWDYDTPGGGKTRLLKAAAAPRAADPATVVDFALERLLAPGSVVIDVSNGYVTVVPEGNAESDGSAVGSSAGCSGLVADGEGLSVLLKGTDSTHWYRVEYKDALSDSEWIPSDTWVRGSDSGDVLMTVPKGSGPSRFYRVSVSEAEPER